MAKQSKAQKRTMGRIMHEYKHGELRIRGSGPKVKSPKQAIAIGLREAGASKYESPQENKENLKKTKAKERRGQTAQQRTEGRSGKAKTARSRQTGSEKTKAALYQEAKRRDIPGRSKMSKTQLERALHR